MELVWANLMAMGAKQLLLALVFLAAYALTLSSFAGTRGRLVAVAGAALAAAGFAACSRPWEAGVVLIALAPVGMGLFAAAAWVLWQLTRWGAERAASPSVAPVRRIRQRAAASSGWWSRARARLHSI